eukprot:267094_1
MNLPKWSKINEFPTHYGTPIKINDATFCVVKGRCLMQYNVITNQWIEWIKYPLGDMLFNAAPAIHHKLKQIFIFDPEEHQMWKIHYDTQDIEIFDDIKLNRHSHSIAEKCKCLFINDQLHIIGGKSNRKHLIYDENTKIFNLCHTFDDFEFRYLNPKHIGLIHLPESKQIILISGHDHSRRQFWSKSCSIYSFSISLNKWENMYIDFPIDLYNFGYCVSFDEKYIILLGGWNSERVCYNMIHVIDMEKYKVQESKIKCPVSTPLKYNAIIMRDSVRENLIVFVFFRRSWKECNMECDMFPPRYIIQLIQLWFVDECIHLLQFDEFAINKVKGNHWKIMVNDIINNLI